MTKNKPAIYFATTERGYNVVACIFEGIRYNLTRVFKTELAAIKYAKIMQDKENKSFKLNTNG